MYSILLKSAVTLFCQTPKTPIKIKDEDCLKILKNIRLSIAEGGKLIVIEGVVPTGDRPHFTKLLDLEMMIIYPSGRERTEAEYRQLFQAAGFRLTRIVPTLTPVSAIEAVCI